MKVLRAENLVKRFKGFTAVDDISFELKEGEILGMLGPNGAGKTTTIQMLLGILTPTGGRVEYFGLDFAKHREEILEKVNFSSTYVNLPWNLTVRENLTFISWLYAIPDRKKRLEEVRESFKLDDLWHKRTSELSSGQLTRLNLAKAFLNSPRVLLLDEPTASLDPGVARSVREFLTAEQKRSGLSIVFTSHNMSEVEEVCDRVIFVNRGKIIGDDTPRNLASSVSLGHVELRILAGLSAAQKYCKQRGFVHRTEKDFLRADLPNREIAEFLRELMVLGVRYDDISIEKATLEDYFLKVARQKFEEEL